MLFVIILHILTYAYSLYIVLYSYFRDLGEESICFKNSYL